MRVPSLVCVLVLVSVVNASAGDGVLRLNSDDPFLIGLVEKGLRGSETFRGLYQRLEQSDVVVHLRHGPRGAGASGYNQFITTAGAFRFVQITLAVRQPTNEAVALLGHELQHAVELADAPTVTDGRAYEELYARIGHRTCTNEHVRCFDTSAAVRVGHSVHAELRRNRSAAMAGAAAVGDIVRGWLAQVRALADQRRHLR